ncbi:MAG TPA: DUF3578 domain-containing protein, partial [Amycolatopsis sp.]|nr:DUF3578 domain-containing protein [Amycolatopsis sp.]
MDLHTLLSTIAHTYNRDRELDQQSPAAKQLRACENVLCRYVPPGYVIKGSSGQGTRAAVPWIGVFDPDETTSATRGMYVVYLFSADMRNIFLTLLQGSEDLRKELKGSPARIKLSRKAEVIREHIVPNLVEDLDDHVSLQAPSSIERPKYYEAGTIV